MAVYMLSTTSAALAVTSVHTELYIPNWGEKKNDNITSSRLSDNHILLPLQTSMIGTRIANMFHYAHSPVKLAQKIK